MDFNLLKEISSEVEYQQVLLEIEKLFDAKPLTKGGEELEKLFKLIEQYEDKNYPIT